ncbi:MAG: hypothetical protein ACOY82_18590 [Pseudomonadota bacterium]
MKQQPIRERVKAALADPSTTDAQRGLVESVLRENGASCIQQAGRNYYFFLLFSFLFTFLVATDVEKVDIGGMELSNKNPAILLIPVLSAFCFYRAICLYLYQDMLHKATQAYYREALKSFEANDITDLFAYPDFMEIENTFDNILKMPLQWVSLVWIVLVGVVCFVCPFVWFFFASSWMLDLFAAFQGVAVSAIVLAWIFLLRALLLVIQTWSY